MALPDVEPRLYRFRILNGCNARILEPQPRRGADVADRCRRRPVGQAGTRESLALAPAERADVIADFRGGRAAETCSSQNATPQAPVSTPAPPLGPVMQFRAATQGQRARAPHTSHRHWPGRAASLPSPVRRRFITLDEVAPETGGWFLNLNAVLRWDGCDRVPRFGTVEDSVNIKITGDTYPIQIHLVTHQVSGVHRSTSTQPDAFGGPNGVPGGIDPTPFATGRMTPPDPTERGFKDTTKVNPGYFTTIRARFDLPGGVPHPRPTCTTATSSNMRTTT